MNLSSLRASLVGTWLASGACGGAPPPTRDPNPSPAPSHNASASPTATVVPERVVREGTLVTWAGRNELGREHFRDDGRTLRSEITFNGAQATLTIDARTARVEAPGHTVEHAIPAGAFAIENGSWQAYARLADGITPGTPAHDVQLMMAARGVTMAGTVQVTTGEEGARLVMVTVGPVVVEVTLDPNGVVTRGRVAAQRIDVLPDGVAPASPVVRAAPDGVTESPVEVARGALTVRGVLWRPAHATGAVPVVVFIAGSGPTDRDGNQPPSLMSDTYRLLAESLAREGVASVRYDKRGVGDSTGNFAMASTTFQDFVDDAAAVVAAVRAMPGIGHVTVAGHSEGGIMALALAQHTPVDGLVLLATPGRTMAHLVREQLARQMPADEMVEVDRILAAIRAGRAPDPVPGPLAALFRADVRPYLRSEIDIDPEALQHTLRVRTAVVQGETDAQVGVDDARRLAAARRGVRLVLLPHANHLFKEEASSALPQGSYTDATRPLAHGVVEAIVEIARL